MLANETVPSGTRRTGEQGTARVLDVLVQAVVLPESALQRDELLVGITLKRNKEESGVELASTLVHTVRKRVAAAQYSLAPVLTGEAYVGV